MILLERKDELEELFLGSWRTHYELYKPQSFSIGRADKKIKDTRSNIRQYKPSYKHGRWLLTS